MIYGVAVDNLCMCVRLAKTGLNCVNSEESG